MGNHRPFFGTPIEGLPLPGGTPSLSAPYRGDFAMKNVVLLAAVVALSACSQQAEETKETAAPAETTAAAVPVSTGTPPGDYEVKTADGTIASTTINADGTYVDTDPKGKATKGKIAFKDGKDCFDPDGDEAEVCWSLSPAAADGSFAATAPDGTAVTVTPKKN